MWENVVDRVGGMFLDSQKKNDLFNYGKFIGSFFLESDQISSGYLQAKLNPTEDSNFPH
jgi:hypothetical protein